MRHPGRGPRAHIVSTTAIPEGLSASDIDAFVSKAMAAGEDLYHLDAGALGALDADLVVTQDLCAVCAVDVSVVDDALAYLGCRAEVLTIDPHTLDEVLASITTLGVRDRHRGARPRSWPASTSAWMPWSRPCAAAPVRGRWCSSGPTRPSPRATGCRRW